MSQLFIKGYVNERYHLFFRGKRERELVSFEIPESQNIIPVDAFVIHFNVLFADAFIFHFIAL